MTGYVKFFDAVKGYGFIRAHGAKKEDKDVFVHVSALDGARMLAAGQEVEFEVYPTIPDPRAMRVKLLGKLACEPVR
jgi:CspA family cold shock protein